MNTSINYYHSENIHNTHAAHEVLPFLFRLVTPESILDLGCGTGSWLKVAKQLGAQRILGIDGIEVEKHLFCINDNEFKLHNLMLPLSLEERYDVSLCLEVVEHLPASAARNIVKTLTDCSSVVLFSAAIPGQGGQYHVNEQWPDYWQHLFAEKKFVAFDILREKFWFNEKVDWWYRQNMVLYAKEDYKHVLGEPSIRLLSKVHPELLKLKDEEILNLRALRHDQLFRPKFIPSLKQVVKSVLKQD